MDEKTKTIEEAFEKADKTEPVNLEEWKSKNTRYKLFMLSSDKEVGWGIINSSNPKALESYMEEAKRLRPEAEFVIV